MFLPAASKVLSVLRSNLANLQQRFADKADELLQSRAILNLFVDRGGCGTFGMRRIIVPYSIKRQIAHRNAQTFGLLHVSGDDFGGICLDDWQQRFGLPDCLGAIGGLQADGFAMSVKLIPAEVDFAGALRSVVVRGNWISDCSRGIQIESPQNYTIPERKMSDELMKQIYANYRTVPAFAGSDNLLVEGNFIKRMDRDGIYVSGCAERAVTGLVVTGNFLSDSNMGNYDSVRDVWADGLDRAVIRNNFSAGTSAEKKLSPVQGIGKNCKATVFESN